MVRRTRRKPQRRWRAYRAGPLNRHRIRVRWLLAQRTRMHNYLRRFRGPDDNNGENGAAEDPGRQARENNDGGTDD